MDRKDYWDLVTITPRRYRDSEDSWGSEDLQEYWLSLSPWQVRRMYGERSAKMARARQDGASKWR